jgi:alpha-tubulin suppressor-like RCC1 family protein
LLRSARVDCWGGGAFGQLGNGSTSNAATPVAVQSVSGGGPLSGVASIVADDDVGYCALLRTGAVDCWGSSLGDGSFDSSPRPVSVEGVGGIGVLASVASLATDGDGYCAMLTTGAVDCWGGGQYGQLGDGVFYMPIDQGAPDGSATPVAVVSTSGTGLLTGVRSLAADNLGGEGYCALLDSGGVDCWGFGGEGELGGGEILQTGLEASAIPVVVVSPSGTGLLQGVTALAADDTGYCALLGSGSVDCWGQGDAGQLGNGKIYNYNTGPPGSAIPVAVLSTSRKGRLAGVASLMSNDYSYCAQLISKRVDCWGEGGDQLGGGPRGDSAIPVPVRSTSGRGSLLGVASLANDVSGYCALLTSKEVDCWGAGAFGQLGNARYYPIGSGSSVPVEVVSTSGRGRLGGVASIGVDSLFGYCALLASSNVDCWGLGQQGQLGNGRYYGSKRGGSAVPVRVAP